MKHRRYIYILIPVALTIAWAILYIPWARRQKSDGKLPVEKLPPAVLVWHDDSPNKDSPEVTAARKRAKELENQLIAIAAEEMQAKREKMKRDGVVPPPPDGR